MKNILKAGTGLAALVFTLAAPACGGDDDSSPATPGSQQSSSAERRDDRPSAREHSEEGSEAGSEAGEPAVEEEVPPGPPPSARAAAERDSGGGAEQFRVPGGDNSIQGFGEEANDAERESAAAVLHAFLEARAAEEWAVTCSYLSQTVLDQLRRLAPSVEGAEGEDCPETLAALSPKISGRAEGEFTQADVGSLRVEDGRAFILYRGAGTDYTVTMANEDGEWKVATLAPLPLS